MTRKDYIKIARIIKENVCHNYNNRLNKYSLIDDLCVMLKQDNSLFNSDKFRGACE